MLRRTNSISKNLGLKCVCEAPEKFNRWIGQVSEKHNHTARIIVEGLRPQYKKAYQQLTYRIDAINLGDYLEFGVYPGSSMSCMFAIFQACISTPSCIRARLIRQSAIDASNILQEICHIVNTQAQRHSKLALTQ